MTMLGRIATLALGGVLLTTPPVAHSIAHADPPAAQVDLSELGPGHGPARGLPWSCLGPENIAGTIHAIAFGPSPRGDVYVTARGGGIWRSRDGGDSWIPLGDALPTLSLSAVAVTLRDPKVIILGTGDAVLGNDWIRGVGILRSSDRGKTWQRTNVVKDSYSVRNGYHAIEVNSVTGVILAAGVTELLRSTDDGATWVPVDSPGNWTDVKWRPGSADTAYAVREFGGVYLSEDGGRSFHHLGGGLPPDSTITGQSRLAICAGNPSYVYANVASTNADAPSNIYRSVDGGLNWSFRSGQRDLYFADWLDGVLAVNPGDPDDVIAGGFGLYRSRDGGLTWATPRGVYPHDCNAIAFRPGSVSDVWLASEEGVFESTDGGDTWQARNRGLVTLELYHVCSAGNSQSLAYAGSQYEGTVRYVGGPEWQLTGGDGRGPGRDGMICNCDPRDPEHVYGETQYGGHFVSRDGLRSTIWINDGIFGNGRFITPVDMDPSDPERLLTATDAGIFKTTNGGASWARAGDGNDVVSISISPIVGRWAWALERSTGLVRRSSDGGTTWQSFQAAPFAGIGGAKVLADPSDTLAAFCTFVRHPQHPPLVLHTEDGGRTWTDVSGNLQGGSVHTIAVDPSQPGDWFVGTGAGVWCSQDGGGSWFRYGKGLPNVVVLDIEISGAARVLRAATLGRGLWEVGLRGGRRALGASRHLLLDPVGANPHRGTVSFRYGGQGALELRLRVYDVRGRMVSEVARACADGIMRVAPWESHRVADGVYFAVLQSGETRLVRKLVVVR